MPASKRKKSPARGAKKAVARKAAPKRKAPAKKASAKNAKARPKAKAPEGLSLSNSPIRNKQTKAQIIAELAEATGHERKTVRDFFGALKNQVERHMKRNGSGEITIPELAVKVKRVKKAATKKRKGRNPFTGEEIIIAAKPARTAVRATALKALKELAG